MSRRRATPRALTVLALLLALPTASPEAAAADDDATTAAAYAYLYSSTTGEHGFATFATSDPQRRTLVGKQFGNLRASAGEYVDGIVYAFIVRLGSNNDTHADSWATFDGETFAQLTTVDARSMHRAVDMAYDYTTNTMYALVEVDDSSGELGATRLCAVDLATGGLTAIGAPAAMQPDDAPAALVALACDDSGRLFAMSQGRYLYTLDKHSAAATPAGARHALPTAPMLQSMAFDPQGGLWWAQQHPAHSYFCAIDLATAAPAGFADSDDYANLARLDDYDQLTALFFKGRRRRSGALNAVGNLTATVVTDADGTRRARLDWTLPDSNLAGEPATPTALTVYRLGLAEPVATLDGGATTLTDAPAALNADGPAVAISYQVIASNADGYGFPAFVTIASDTDGIDAPAADAPGRWRVAVADGRATVAAPASIAAIASVSLADMGGRTLRRAAAPCGAASVAIDLQGLAHGAYVLTARAAGGSSARFKIAL